VVPILISVCQSWPKLASETGRVSLRCALSCQISASAVCTVTPAGQRATKPRKFDLIFNFEELQEDLPIWPTSPIRAKFCCSVPNYSLSMHRVALRGEKKFDWVLKFNTLWWRHVAAQRQSWVHMHNYKLSRVQRKTLSKLKLLNGTTMFTNFTHQERDGQKNKKLETVGIAESLSIAFKTLLFKSLTNKNIRPLPASSEVPAWPNSAWWQRRYVPFIALLKCVCTLCIVSPLGTLNIWKKMHLACTNLHNPANPWANLLNWIVYRTWNCSNCWKL